MINYIKKDITTVECGIVAHGVNCQHKMGSGVALAIRKKWPAVYEAYMNSPKGQALLGTAHIININRDMDNLFVANCYTQVFYGYGGGRYASLEAVESSLRYVYRWADIYDVPVYMPKIGCGLGGLSWDREVKDMVQEIDSEFTRVNTNICIWE